MNRRLITQVHVALATFFLPFAILMPLSGFLYLAGIKGETKKTEAFRVTDSVPHEVSEQPEFFRAHFRQQGLDFDFQSIKANPNEFLFRPSTRVHYAASTVTPGEIIFTKLEPDLVKRLIELHKGHGPQLMRYLEMGFGIALLLLAFSGIWLTMSGRAYRGLALTGFGIGLALVGMALV